MRVGLTGTFGSGKTTVAGIFAECGARVIDADAIARETLAPGSEALAEVAAAWPGVIGADGALDRSRLAAIVFADPQALKRLEAIVHPRVRRRELELLERYEREGTRLIVLDVPLLLEKGLSAFVDRVVVVTVDEETRVERLVKNRALTREEIQRRIGAQAPQSEKSAKADFVIDNSGSLRETRRRTRELARRLLAETERTDGGGATR